MMVLQGGSYTVQRIAAPRFKVRISRSFGEWTSDDWMLLLTAMRTPPPPEERAFLKIEKPVGRISML